MHAYMLVTSDSMPTVKNTYTNTPTLGQIHITFGRGLDLYLKLDQAQALLTALTPVVAEVSIDHELAATNLTNRARLMAIQDDH